MTDLTCFKAYGVRGEIVVNIDEDIADYISRVVAQIERGLLADKQVIETCSIWV